MQLRTSNIEKLPEGVFDVLIIGGGINGSVSAAALAGKGVKTALIDKRDFAGFTSMNSSNLAWGGIKYMETYDFPLVRKLCMSRNHLIRNYPSTVQEIRFFATIVKGFRFHPLYLYAGGWLYWFIGNGFTKIPRLLSKSQIEKEEPVVKADNAIGGFEYSDAYLYDNDARFVWNFIRSAMNRGCIAANYVESLGAARNQDGLWVVKARDTIGGKEFEIKSKVLINACGPFVDQHNEMTGQKTEHRHALSKGIHLIVRRLTPHKRVLAFFADDGRLFFVIPMGARTCIGTTDTRVEDPIVHITDDDIDFVLNNINARLKLDKPLTRDDIIGTRCGVRPLALKTGGGQRDFLQLSRKHAIDVNRDDKHLSIFGGKLTDCINVGNEVSDIVRRMSIDVPYDDYKWYGEPPDEMRDEFFHQAKLMRLDDYTKPGASEPLSTRYWRRYGLQAIELLERIREDPAQAEIIIKGTEYTHCELYLAAQREMITKLEDFLRRRSKIALVARKQDIMNSPGLMDACQILFGEQAQAKFDEYFAELKAAEAEVEAAKKKSEYMDKLSEESHADNPAHSEALNWT